MTSPDPALTAALENLSMQVNSDNVLAVHSVFRTQADQLERVLRRLTNTTTVGLCGQDPVSREAAASFNSKIDQLLEIHRAHQRELSVAADHLQQIAAAYGFTESEIGKSLR